MFKEYSEMFKPICEFTKETTQTLPYGDHPNLFNLLYSDTLLQLQGVLDQAEFDSLKKNKAYRLCEFVHNSFEQFLEKAVNPEWRKRSVEEKQAHIQALCARPQVAQRTDEWYKQTANVLTASEFSNLFGSARQRANLIASKANYVPKDYLPQLAFPTSDINALTWGIRFEPVVKQILEKKWSAKIHDLGRLVHSTDTHLAASPDGLIVSTPHKERLGRLVEIKCPYSRKIGGDIPFDYWVQMQIQMEVADIDECEYIEVEILSKRANQETPLDLSGCKYKGAILLWSHEEKGYDYEYLTTETVEGTPVRDGWTLVETIPWGVSKYHQKTVQRDRNWFASTEPWRASFWEDVERSRKGTTLLIPAPPPSAPKLKINVCKIQDEESS
jgi:hypothetical protein